MAFVLGGLSQPAYAQWTDSKTGQVLPSFPVITDPNGEPGHQTHYVAPDLVDPRTAHDPGTGRNFFYDKTTCSWKDSKTGQTVASFPVITDPNGEPGHQTHYVAPDLVDPRTAHDPGTGRNFFRNCPPPTATTPPPPPPPSHASADGGVRTGPYVAFEVGIQRFNGVQIDNALGQAVGTNYKIGYDVDGSVGYNFSPFRAEIEVGYKSGGLKTLDPPGGPLIDGAGTVNAWSAIANIFYDLAPAAKFNPYIGGGIGVAGVKINDLRPTGATVATFDNNAQTVFAWQVIAGMSTPINNNIDILVQYHYFSAQNINAFASNGFVTKTNYKESSVQIGFRYKW